ncbi:MAG: DUF167 domain-containing protein [Methanolinea sp.]|jgi:uncharacterized protein (TIGR00251 family)|nr:DUF167 domain-containing protein [Methanolinea sp.]
MDDYRGALTPTREGTVIALDVTAGAKETAFPHGYNAWRKSIVFLVREPPEGGRANAEIVKVISQLFSLPSSRVRILSGASSHRKRVLVEGLDQEKVLAILSGHGSSG